MIRLITFTPILILALFDRISFSQEPLDIRIRDASREYDLAVQVKDCGGDDEKCSGPGSVSIYRKGAKAPFQILSLSAIEIYQDRLAYDPELTGKARKPDDAGYSSFIFGDFNFDGMKDLAICTGKNGGYGSQSYTVYLFNSRVNKFVENKRLSKLTEDIYIGFFSVEAKKKLLVAFWKSGCCFHQTEKYRVVANRPVLVEEIIEDGTGGEFMVTTSRKLVNGKWVKRVRKEKLP